MWAQSTFTNPIIPIDAADPTVLLDDDGYYYMCCTEHWSGEGMPLWRSADMVNWTKITTVFPDGDANRPATKDIPYLWAPELVKIGSKYVLYFSNAQMGNQSTPRIFVSTADKPYGPYSTPVELFSSSSIGVTNSIDPSYFKDDNGQQYLIWGSFNGIYSIKLNEAGTGLAAGAQKKLILQKNSSSDDKEDNAEAACIYKRNGYYYLITSVGTTVLSKTDSNPYHLNVARSSNNTSTFDNVTFVNQDGNNVNGTYRGGFMNLTTYYYHSEGLLSSNDYVYAPGHCSNIIKDASGKEWIFYHGYAKKNGNWDWSTGRVLYACNVIWDNKPSGWLPDGWPGIMPPSATPIDNPAIDVEKQLASARQIRTAADLQQLATDVNAGNPFINAVLMNDIDCSSISNWTPIGKDEDHKFQGIIDGQGHKIMNLRADKSGSNDVALVGVVNGGAQFKNLVIDASCEFKGDNQIAGFVGHAKGTGSIQFLNCGNEAFINASGANASGFLGYTSGISTYWDNCYNTGDITGDRESAAFSAWAGDRLRNCWNTGRTMGTDQDGDKWKSLTRGDITLGYENTYDLNGANNSNTGMPADYATAWLASGRLAYTMGSPVWMQKISVDAHPYPFGTDKVYAGTECGSSTTGYTNNADGKIHKYTYNNDWSTAGLTSTCSCGATQATVPATDGWLMVSNADQLETCMDAVEAGKENLKVKLTADIDFTAKGNKMFGRDADGHKFLGEFDGQYHKVTVAYNDAREKTGFFGLLYGASVKNLTVDGTITMKNYNISGGIYATATDNAGKKTTIDNCISAITYIDASGHDATFGGIGGSGWNTVINNCAFVGKVVASRATGNGGIIGYANGGDANVSISNSYVAANINWGDGAEFARNMETFTNCYKLEPSDATLASGEFCYDVIGGDWTQNLGEDAYPVLNHKKIFINGTYANVDETIELDEAKSFSTKAEFTTNVNMKRTLKANMWNTFCVPFDMENSELDADAEVKELTGLKVDGDHFTMTFTPASSIEAGKPYMVRVPNAVSMLELGQKTVKNDIIEASETADGGTLTYTGVFNSGKAPMGSFIISSNKFYLVDSDVNLKAYRGYITAEANSAAVKALSFIFGEDTETAIENVNITENGSEMTMTFDLSGRRIQKAQKGINIINGKKVIIK